jgi:hypothetical protein
VVRLELGVADSITLQFVIDDRRDIKSQHPTRVRYIANVDVQDHTVVLADTYSKHKIVSSSRQVEKERKKNEARTGNGSRRYDMAVQELEKAPYRYEDRECFIWIRRFFHSSVWVIIILRCSSLHQSVVKWHTDLRDVLFGFVQSLHSVSTLTPSVLIESLRQPWLFAQIARTSDMSRSLSTTVLNFCSGGSRMCTYNPEKSKKKEKSQHPLKTQTPTTGKRQPQAYIRLGTQRLIQPLHIRRPHHLNHHIMRHAYLPPHTRQAIDLERQHRLPVLLRQLHHHLLRLRRGPRRQGRRRGCRFKSGEEGVRGEGHGDDVCGVGLDAVPREEGVDFDLSASASASVCHGVAWSMGIYMLNLY